MSGYFVGALNMTSPRVIQQVDALLHAEGIRRDHNLDFSCGIYDDDSQLIATGSCFGNTVRCLAVSSAHQGEGLMALVMTRLMEEQITRGNPHVFCYTKPSSAPMITDLGFHEIARVPGEVVFLENKRQGFRRYLESLEPSRRSGDVVSAIVMNANPFSLGHRYLVEQACTHSDVVHLFVVSEDASLFPLSVRMRLIRQGTADFQNLIIHETSSYMVSRATFPGYFQKDEDSVVRGQAMLDLAVFTKIADRLDINRRYVGTEPTSGVTNLYNATMLQQLPDQGIDVVEVPRLEIGGHPVSASVIRQAVHDDQWDLVRALVPDPTWEFLRSPEAEPIITVIQRTADVVHH